MSINAQRVLKAFVILKSGNLNAAHGGQVVGDKLGVEQLEAPKSQPRDQMNQSHF
jgi:hypothetical protein